jgi:transcriptional regulator of arginine metabolism
VKKKAELNVDSRMIRILRDTLLELDHAGHMIIIKTMSGSANVAGEVIDNLGLPEILGTIAGDNTILAVVRHEQDAGEVADRIRSMIET